MSLRDWPIKQKLTAILLLISGLVLLLTAAAFVTYEVVAFRQMTLKDLSTLGRIIAANSTASLAFANEADAREILSALRAEPHVVAAGLYDKDGRVFSRYPADLPGETLPAVPGQDGYRFEQGYVIGFEPVAEVGNARLGTLFLKSDMKAVSRTLRLSAAIATGVMGSPCWRPISWPRSFRDGSRNPFSRWRRPRRRSPFATTTPCARRSSARTSWAH